MGFWIYMLGTEILIPLIMIIFGYVFAHKAPEKIIVFYRKGLLFAFNFHPTDSVTNVLVPVHQNTDYTVALSTDDKKYGGQELIEHMTYPAKVFDGKNYIELYLPARTAVVLKEGKLNI